MRLIDADAVEKITWQDPSYTDPINVLTEVREKVRALPTINAVPVIRCKECKHYRNNKCDQLSLLLFLLGNEEDDYCSHAERGEK